jgi:sialate O-acetylesterase
MIKPKQYKRTLLALLLSVASGFSALQAKVQLPAFIGDNMVLQQKEKVKIWGTSTAVGKELSVNTSWNNKSYQVEVDQQEAGKSIWRHRNTVDPTKLPSMMVIN